jgi:cell division protein FtsW (lipid II flippase)
MAKQLTTGEFGKRNFRWRERLLFLVPSIFLLLEMFQLPLAQYYKNNIDISRQQNVLSLLPTVHDLIPIIGFLAAVALVHVVLTIFFPRSDQMIFPIVALLSGLGVLLALRNGPDAFPYDSNLGLKQLLWVLIGLVAFLVTLFGLRSLNWLRRYKYTWAAIGLLLVAITLGNALRVKNLDSPTHDQLNFGPFALQPSEFLKIIIVVFFAAYLSENQDVIAAGSFRLGPISLPPMRQLGPLLLMLGIALLLFLGVRELGLALLIYGIFLSMLYLGSNKVSYVIGGLVVFFILGFIGYALFSYVRARFAAVGLDMVNWQNWTTGSGTNTTVYFAQNTGAQIAQGLIAIASGGILGTGFGLGHASALVPVAQSDMVVSVLGEEYGLAGLFALIGFYLVLIYRGFRIAIEARGTFNQLLAAGLTSIFGIQTLIICAGNLKLIPLTGIPLPFLSYGGSSVIANFIIIGILLRISHNTALEKEGLA